MLNDRDFPCVGYCDEPAGPFTRVWFAPWFLEWLKAGLTIDVPAFRYVREGDIIRQIVCDHPVHYGKNKPVEYMYALTGEYDVKGYRLGVWPD